MSIEKKLKIYLAGHFGPYTSKEGKSYSDWRDYVKEQAPHHDYIDPRINPQYSMSTLFEADVTGVLNSDAVFLYRKRGQKDVSGAATEAGVAIGKSRATGIETPIFMVNEERFIHPFPTTGAKRLFTDFEAGVTYLKNLKSLEQALEFEAIYKTINEL